MTKQHSVVAATLVAACIVVAVTAGEQNQGDRFAGVELTAAPGPMGCSSSILCLRRCPTDWSPRCELFQTARFAS